MARWRERLTRPGAAAPLIFGILNVTPDSFHVEEGGGADPARAIEHARRLVREGADVIDIGAESTRPGATPVPEAVEIGRLTPVVAEVSRLCAVPISVDTMKPRVARAAMAAGASIWNDITALRFDPESLAVAADMDCDVILTHMRGVPATMQVDPRYDDVVVEVVAFLQQRVRDAVNAGIDRTRLWIDPGIGFGKSLAHNLELLASLDRIVDLGLPVLLGASRKGFIRGIDPTAKQTTDRLAGSLAAALAGARAGVAGVRVHDVAETRQALEVWAAIQGMVGAA